MNLLFERIQYFVFRFGLTTYLQDSIIKLSHRLFILLNCDLYHYVNLVIISVNTEWCDWATIWKCVKQPWQKQWIHSICKCTTSKEATTNIDKGKCKCHDQHSAQTFIHVKVSCVLCSLVILLYCEAFFLKTDEVSF
jgi:hypothetical protein